MELFEGSNSAEQVGCQAENAACGGVGTLEEEDLVHCATVWNRMTFEEKEKYRNIDNCNTSNIETVDPVSSMELCKEDDADDTILDPFCPEKPSCSRSLKPRCTTRRTKRNICQPRKRKRRFGVKRKKWVKPGPITNNPYLNFVRTVRRRYCGLLPKQLVILAAYEWRCLSDNKKLRYRRQACLVSASQRQQLRCECNINE
ncbi:protamine-like [Drosophila novamexicana]|uniref:protamine-like n=1 Tax=Drosophila novamexicana TaxID=47314 RepID=UPI0011E5EF1E|nr:protamine-like [Drosophila novamexicana]